MTSCDLSSNYEEEYLNRLAREWRLQDRLHEQFHQLARIVFPVPAKFYFTPSLFSLFFSCLFLGISEVLEYWCAASTPASHCTLYQVASSFSLSVQESQSMYIWTAPILYQPSSAALLMSICILKCGLFSTSSFNKVNEIQ
jgi:hypothetical protein